MVRSLCLAALLLLLTGMTTTAADTTATAPSGAKLPIVQAPVTTRHTVVIQGQSITYEATAGHLSLAGEDGTERARVFFVAYTRTGITDTAARPITFSFNGGPGSSSVWLHLGVLGPKRVRMNDDGTTLPPPFGLVDNTESWLDLTDMVFIDPVSTGYSRAVKEDEARQYHGYVQDINAVGDFVRRYVSDYRRWSSPKYIIGESYGTTRASGLVHHLQQRYGMYINGVILVSSVLNFQTLDFNEGNDLPYAMFLPTYTATAWYHRQLPADMQAKTLAEVVAEARTFASTDYTVALMKGDGLAGAERTSMVDRLHRFTGLSRDYLDKARLRPVIFRVCQELLRDSGMVIGRFDSRYKGLVSDRLSESMERDPSHHPTIAGCFATCINDYLRRNLGVTTTLPYEVLTGRVHPWDYSNAQNEYLNVAPRLRDAMLDNPDLRVWVANGYYDLATPFMATEYTFSHLGLPKERTAGITMTYYPAGHMMYLLKESLVQMKQDARQFYRR